MVSRIAIRSSYSLLWGSASPKKIITHLASQGCSAVAITDKDNLYALHEALEAAKEANISLIVGSELTTKEGSIFAFADSLQGYSRLCTLLSYKKCEAEFYLISSLIEDSHGLQLATTSSSLLTQLAHKVPSLYGAISPFWTGVVPTSRSLHIPLIAIDDATFLSDKEYEVHKVLRAIATGTTLGTLLERDCEDPRKRVLTTKEYLSFFRSWPEALKESERVASLCSDLPLFESLVFPDYPNASNELRKRSFIGAERRYGELSDAIVERLEYELNIITKKGFAPYFLVLDDIVAMASRTCGRGSAAASIVSYALGITQVDPIAHNLYFERFLTLERVDPPDIDVDFAWDERDNILKALLHRFGEEHCVRVANHNLFQWRSALRECAKAYGFTNTTITQKIEHIEEQGEISFEDPLWKSVFESAKSLVGLPRSIGMHCGGVVITPKPISTYLPVEKSAQGYPLGSWEKEGIERAKLVKIDLLGNRSLAVVRDTLENLRKEGIVIDERQWRPIEDRETQLALSRGDSMGVFYIESPAMRQFQKKSGKGDFDHIVIHSSMIRPAANLYINEYIRRLKGGSWKALHPRLEKILEETYGILCYQEDVSKTAIALANFTESQADALRKVVTKKSSHHKLSHYERLFKEGCRTNKIEKEVIDQIWSMILSFEGYSFCKPHSASYALLSFQSAYLRVHHKGAFMAAVLTNRGGYYHPQAYISEIRRMGLTLFGPDINKSSIAYYASGSTVVVGLMAISNLSRAAMEQIENERLHRGPFLSLEEASRRLTLTTDEIVTLVAAGTFDSLGPTFSRSEQLKKILTSERPISQGEQHTLFDSERRIEKTLIKGDQKRDWKELYREFETLGFLRDGHPLYFWASKIAFVKRKKACDLFRYVEQTILLIGWPITRKMTKTKGGEAMEFISFEDETALYETVLFPPVYQKYRKVLYRQRALIIEGKVCNDYGSLIVEVKRLKFL